MVNEYINIIINKLYTLLMS